MLREIIIFGKAIADSMSDLERLLRNVQELVTQEELEQLLETGGPRTAYIGLEPSGMAHLGWRILSNKMHDLVECGFELNILLADWHAYINDKLGGNIDDIRACSEYMKDYFAAAGLEGKVKYVTASEMCDGLDYWEKVLRVAKHASLSRVKRAMTIMGRKEDEALVDSSKYIYPAMQVADIFALDVRVAFGGMDQRKAHMLARDVADKLGWRKPIALHTPLLSGLTGGERMDPIEAKMSKSRPEATLYVHDTAEQITGKLKKAYCPQSQVDGNPVLEIWKYIIFQERESDTIERPEKFGGDMVFESYDALASQFESGELHPADLKSGTAAQLESMLAPIRDYYEKHPDNLEKVRQMTVTR